MYVYVYVYVYIHIHTSISVYLSVFLSRHFRVISSRDFYFHCFAPQILSTRRLKSDIMGASILIVQKLYQKTLTRTSVA